MPSNVKQQAQPLAMASGAPLRQVILVDDIELMVASEEEHERKSISSKPPRVPRRNSLVNSPPTAAKLTSSARPANATPNTSLLVNSRG